MIIHQLSTKGIESLVLINDMIRIPLFLQPLVNERAEILSEHQWLLTQKRKTMCSLMGKHTNLKKIKIKKNLNLTRTLDPPPTYRK